MLTGWCPQAFSPMLVQGSFAGATLDPCFARVSVWVSLFHDWSVSLARWAYVHRWLSVSQQHSVGGSTFLCLCSGCTGFCLRSDCVLAIWTGSGYLGIHLHNRGINIPRLISNREIRCPPPKDAHLWFLESIRVVCPWRRSTVLLDTMILCPVGTFGSKLRYNLRSRMEFAPSHIHGLVFLQNILYQCCHTSWLFPTLPKQRLATMCQLNLDNDFLEGKTDWLFRRKSPRQNWLIPEPKSTTGRWCSNS